MPLTLDRMLQAIATHSAGLADAATGNLTAPVANCPDWDVAGLVGHLSDVHWFWRTIADEQLRAAPDESRRPATLAGAALVDRLRVGSEALVATLADADQSAPCWTWYPPRQEIGFITRHQVQEAAVHHWDAAHAAGRELVIEPDVAVDSVEEFITVSLADADDVARSGLELGGSLVLHATDLDRSWTVHQETPSAALTWVDGGAAPTVVGTACDLLLWIYGRVELDVADPGLVAQFRRLSSS